MCTLETRVHMTNSTRSDYFPYDWLFLALYGNKILCGELTSISPCFSLIFRFLFRLNPETLSEVLKHYQLFKIHVPEEKPETQDFDPLKAGKFELLNYFP